MRISKRQSICFRLDSKRSAEIDTQQGRRGAPGKRNIYPVPVKFTIDDMWKFFKNGPPVMRIDVGNGGKSAATATLCDGVRR